MDWVDWVGRLGRLGRLDRPARYHIKMDAIVYDPQVHLCSIWKHWTYVPALGSEEIEGDEQAQKETRAGLRRAFDIFDGRSWSFND